MLTMVASGASRYCAPVSRPLGCHLMSWPTVRLARALGLCVCARARPCTLHVCAVSYRMFMLLSPEPIASRFDMSCDVPHVV